MARVVVCENAGVWDAAGAVVTPTLAAAAVGGDLTGNLPNPTLATSGVGAGTYGDATHVAQVTIDAKGRVTAATDVAISGGGGSVTYSQNFLSANVSMPSANTYYDGPTLTLVAGTYVLIGQVECQVTGTATSKLWNGTTVYASAEQSSAGTLAAIMFPYSVVVVLATTTTVKISVAGNIGGGQINHVTAVDSGAINTSGLVALKIA